MKREFEVIIEKDEDGFFVSSVPELPGCHTQAKGMDELISRTKEAIELYVEEEPITDFGIQFVGIQIVGVPLNEAKTIKTG